VTFVAVVKLFALLAKNNLFIAPGKAQKRELHFCNDKALMICYPLI